MRETKKLAASMAVAVAAAMLFGASAFAESRPSNATRRRGEGRGTIQRETRPQRETARRRDETRTERSQRSERREATVQRNRESRRSGESRSEVTVHGDRIQRGETRSYDRNRSSESRDRGRNDSWRGNDRSRDDRSRDNNRSYGDRNRSSNDRNRSYGDRNRSHGRNDRSYGRNNNRSYSHRQPYYHSGRVSRWAPYGGGYRVWIVGSPYPFFIPHSHWHRDRFRVGLSIRLGGYYNPGGYYDYYDGVSRGELRGVVESVDYRRDTFVVRNDATGSFVTVILRDRRGDVRAGDYVELYGDWSRSGVFQAYDVDLLN